MPWYFPWSESIKKRACRYLLQHYLGQFLKEKLTLDQLSVDLYNGTGTIKNVQLDVAAINEALDSTHIPLEVVDGFVGNITVSIPWSALVSDNTKMVMSNLEVTLQPKQRDQDTGVMFDSMLSSFSSMTTSMQLAQECLKSDGSGSRLDSTQPYEGVEMFANTIEAVLSKVKVSFLNTIIRLEHLPKGAETGAALEVRVHRMEYFDDQADSGSPVDRPSDTSDKLQYEVAAIANKNIQLVGVNLYCEEFTANRRTSGKVGASESQEPLDSLSPSLSLGLSLSQTADQQPPDMMLRSQDSLPAQDSSPIKIALLMGRQEVKVKIKQKDDVAGPKLEVDGHIGGCHVHLSPRQLHLLLEIAEGLSSPDVNTSSNRPKSAHNKLMDAEDFARVENDLQRQLRSERVQHGHHHVLLGSDDMTTHSLGMSDEDDEILLSLGSTRAGSSSIMESSYSTVRSTATSGSYNPVVGFRKREVVHPQASTRSHPVRSPTSKDTTQKYLDDPSADLTKFKLKVSFLSLMLLHEDPRSRPADDLDQGEAWSSRLSSLADKFFGRVQGVTVSGTGLELVSIRDQFSKACPLDHIGFLCKTLSLEGSQKCSAATYSLNTELTLGQAEVVEAVYDRPSPTHAFLSLQREADDVVPEYCELLVFDKDPDAASKPTAMYSSMQHSAAPSVRIKINTVDSKKKVHRHSSVPNKTDVQCELGRCHCELDVTLMDRISEVLSPQPLAKTPHNTATGSVDPSVYQSAAQTLFSQTMEEEHQSKNDRKSEVKVTSSHATVMLRFPVPDLRDRPEHDQQWWKKNLRRELLILELQQLEMHTVFWAEQTVQQYEVTCREAHGLFQESADLPPRSFVRISTADNPLNEKEEGFDWPRFVVKVFPTDQSVLSHLDDLGMEESGGGHDSLNGACSDLNKPESSPFSRSRVMYDNSEMVIPGSREEMLDFEDKASSNTRLLLELNIPNLNAYLPDRDFLELIYNRVLNDLVLWEPLAPSPLETDKSVFQSEGPWTLNLATQMAHQGGLESFRMCKSGLYNDSSSESEESDFFPSVNEQRQKSRKKHQSERVGGQSKMCLSVNIAKGRLTACTALKTPEECKSQHGEFVVDVGEGILFVSASHSGNPDLQYVCIHSNRAALYHHGCVDTPAPPSVIERAVFTPPPALYPTIFLSDHGLDTRLDGQVGQGLDAEGHDMVSVAVKIDLDSRQNNKFITVGVGVRGATLRHRSTETGQNWIQQLLVLFDMAEFPILGYTPPKVLTELHLHVWSSAIDYRPLFLPYCAILVLESFSISSNVMADSPTSLLRFLFEEAALYLSDKNRPDPRDLEVNLERDYVCVADVGILELCLRTSDGKNPKYPKLELELSNNILHLRTCSDSCQALAQLIVYLASDPDLEKPDSEETGHGAETGHSTEDAPDSIIPPSSPEMRRAHLDQVHDMVADAMRESSSSQNSQEEYPTDRSSSPDVAPDQRPAARVYVNEKYSEAPTATQQTPVSHITASDEESDEDRSLGTMSFSSLKAKEKKEETKSTAKTQKQKGKQQAKHKEQAKTAPPNEESVNFSNSRLLDLCELSEREVTMEMSLSLSEQAEMEDATQEPVEDMPKSSESSGGEEFCVIDDPGLGIAPRNGEPLIRTLHTQPIQLVDNHFYVPLGKSDVLKAPETFPGAVYRYTLQELSLVWYMYGGKDFDSSPASKTTNKTSKALAHNRFGRVGKQGGQVMRRARGGQGRDLDVLMELQLSKMRMQYEIYPEQTEQASRQILVISDIEMRDRLASSKINKFLYQYSSDTVPRQSHTNMFLVKALHSRPEPKLSPSQECSLRVSVQPLRFNIDQDALYFLMMFFSELTARDNEETSVGGAEGESEAPVMQLGEKMMTESQEKISPQELHVKFDEMRQREDEFRQEVIVQEEEGNKDAPVFIKCFVFSPDVPIRLDYHGRYGRDMGQGTWANLVVGLAQLNCSELKLKRLHYKKGLLGTDKLGRYCRDEWLRDIMKNQLPSILGGVGPLHSLVQLVQGVKNLFWMPVEQYKKDGRIVRGIQKGTQSFVTCTAMSTLELTNKLVQTIQYVAELGHEMVSPLPSMRRRKPPRYRLKQPADIREGVVNAYTVITEGLKGTADNLYLEAVDGAENKGLTGAVGGVLRQVPPTVIKPIILTTEATSNILGGMRNQLLPDKKKEDEEKWKPEDS